MAVKKCCIENCHSCSTRKEDIGVTYHKYPKDLPLRDKWMSVTRHKHFDVGTTSYVCSRHFCKSDFQVYKDSKYILKSDAVPSIFTWSIESSNMDSNIDRVQSTKNIKQLSSSSKESESENVDAIKKFMEDQEKEIKEQKCEAKHSMLESQINTDMIQVKEELPECKMQEETLAVANSVMDLILNESEARIISKKEDKECLSAVGKGNSSTALSVGSKVEAKDFGEFWYPAQIVEVDYDEMEVLVHYDNASKKHDEWINVSSPRLRPFINSSPQTSDPVINAEIVKSETSIVKEEIKQEDKPKLKFVVGERCLARWKDNRRFMATVNKDLGNGSYEIIFDDGFHWKCTTCRLYKVKQSSERNSDLLTIDTSSPSSSSAYPSPIPCGAGPSSTVVELNVPQLPIFHTHLFDPTRDYLGSKSERREKKRKLNIKEIFNIGQKKKRKQKPQEDTDDSAPKSVKQRKPRVVQKKIKAENDIQVKTEIKSEIPDAVASIIGTMAKEELVIKQEVTSDDETITSPNEQTIHNLDRLPQNVENDEQSNDFGRNDESDISDTKNGIDPVLEEETKLENFEMIDDRKHEEVIDRIKEVITKLEDGISKAERIESPKVEVKEEESKNVKEQEVTITPDENKEAKIIPIGDSELIKTELNEGKIKKTLSKLKKSKKLRLMQEKKVKKQVEKVKSELEEMKRQVEEMKKQMLLKTEVLSSPQQKQEMPESFLLPGEWCCRWVNGQPVGAVSEIESEVKVDSNSKPALPRRSVQVEDKRLPEGWAKHMVRRSFGNSAGKWDVVLVSPDNRRFHTKTDMRNYLEQNPSEELKQYEYALLDFGVHLKLSRRMGWVTQTGTEEPVIPLPAGLMSSTSPLVKRKKLNLKRVKGIIKTKEKKRRLGVGGKIRRMRHRANDVLPGPSNLAADLEPFDMHAESVDDNPTLEDGYVYVGALKVQIIENLLRCPADGCLKNFRNNTLLKMHIKHYHRELRKKLGATPKVLDLAYARTRPTEAEMTRQRNETESKIIKVKIPRPPKRTEESKIDMKELDSELQVDIPLSPTKNVDNISKTQDSPKLRNALANKPVKRPRVLLPVRRPESEVTNRAEEVGLDVKGNTPVNIPEVPVLDFETAISTHTVTKPIDGKRKGEKGRKGFASFTKRSMSEDEEWLTMNSDVETRSSFPGSTTPDSKTMDYKSYTNAAASSESNEEQKESMYMYTENGERVKIVQMKREEIINCHCGFREEDGLMVQCELCLCWQHALCHNIQRESEVPDKYTCSICLNPRRGRRSKRFLHDQERLYEGTLAGARPSDALRRAHELAANLLRARDALHALRVKYHVATKKNHPKLYLWAKDWENAELNMTQQKLNSDYSDLNIIINNIGKENLPLKTDDIQMDVRTPLSDENDERFSNREVPLGPQTLLSGIMSSPGGASLDLPISTSELERLAKSVQVAEGAVPAPQPEAAIENGACRERLLRHIQRCQALIDARLDSIEAQVAELESQDPSFEDDETADYFPRTKQTIQMLMRDLDTMEELGVIT